jgi:hypothetical protein
MDQDIEFDTDAIMTALREREVSEPCPRCKNDSWAVVPQFLGIRLSPVVTQLSTVLEGYTTFPSVGLVCQRCGFLALHSVQLLGLAPTSGDNFTPL